MYMVPRVTTRIIRDWTTEIDSLLILETTRLQFRSGWGWFFLQVLRETLSSVSVLGPEGHGQSLVFPALWPHGSNLCLCLPVVSSVCVSTFPICMRTSVTLDYIKPLCSPIWLPYLYKDPNSKQDPIWRHTELQPEHTNVSEKKKKRILVGPRSTPKAPVPIFKCTIRWHFIQSQCYATIRTASSQNISSTWREPTKESLPMVSVQRLASTILRSVPVLTKAGIYKRITGRHTS